MRKDTSHQRAVRCGRDTCGPLLGLLPVVARSLRGPARHIGVPLLLVLAAAQGGCEPSIPPVMTVEFSFGEESLDCVAAGVDAINFTVRGPAGVVRAGTLEALVPPEPEPDPDAEPCAPLEIYMAGDEEAYDLDISAVNEDGIEVFVGTCGNLATDRRDVSHTCQVDVAVAPLEVEVLWDLTQSPIFSGSTCWAAGVVRYDIILRDSSGTSVYDRPSEPCGGPDATVLDFGSMPLGDYTLELTGYADDGLPKWYTDERCMVSPSVTNASRCQVLDGAPEDGTP